jgi:pseudouridine-5'-phosphate glycosidase
LGLRGSVLVVNPPPPEAALPVEDVEGAIRQALLDAHQANITGQSVSPFLLERVNQLTEGASMQANLALLLNNARLAAEIARVL